MFRKRGAPPGNKNAYKHGFYSSEFKDKQSRALRQMSTSQLAAEIQLVRVANRRFLEALNSTAAPLDFETQLSALRAINLSAHSITSMIRTHLILARDDAQVDEIINQLMSPPPEEQEPLSGPDAETDLSPSSVKT